MHERRSTKKYFVMKGKGENASMIIPRNVEIPPLRIGVKRCLRAWCMRWSYVPHALRKYSDMGAVASTATPTDTMRVTAGMALKRMSIQPMNPNTSTAVVPRKRESKMALQMSIRKKLVARKLTRRMHAQATSTRILSPKYCSQKMYGMPRGYTDTPGMALYRSRMRRLSVINST